VSEKAECEEPSALCATGQLTLPQQGEVSENAPMSKPGKSNDEAFDFEVEFEEEFSTVEAPVVENHAEAWRPAWERLVRARDTFYYGSDDETLNKLYNRL